MANLWNLDPFKLRHDIGVAGETVPDMFWNAVQARGDKIIMRQKDFGLWRAWTWREVGAIVRELTMGLVALGMRPGECASILSNTSVEWVWCDLAVLSAAGVANGIYPTDATDQVRFLCEDSRSVVLFVEDEEQLDKALEAREGLPHLRKIVVIDTKGLEQFSDPMVITLAQLRAMGASFDRQRPDEFDAVRRIRRPEELAILVYTSGTTGRPKGAMLSHRNLLVSVRGNDAILPQDERDERMCFLPLCHVAERVIGMYSSLYTGTKMNFVENPDTVPENVREIAPTVFGGVPRLWEKFYSAVTIGIKEAGPVQQASYRWALSVGHKVADRVLKGQSVGPWLKLQYHIAGLASLNNVRRFIGIHRCRFLVTGAAPIAPDLIRWYLALGIPMLEAWGQTECTGIGTSMPANGIRLGTIGRACGFNKVQVDAVTGEILVRGPNVFMGYLNQPEKTAETIDADGWLHTGDVGMVDADGYFKITDRMKDIIITAGGKNITPSEWENELKFSPYVTDAIVIGDRRSYLTAIVMIEQENVEKFAQDNDIPFSNYTSLTRAPEVLALIQGEIDKINKKFARVEQIKKFFLFETQLSAEDEELTPTMKLKRKFVQVKYAQQIEAMYR
ncbi:long-chain fatty acid--CoA ligase [Variovorax guangxiensis]|uniref:AMP-dependent synthetase/ligase n=1 Tax=Variovorax guangxiensis TaxID=1775474 RepID=UPI002861E57F|nr:long-chain fatty acid--CoA ligase [Variovorax guangxiensis]MDR6861141.1 long-chain acyl-CoA synthetase [Variovorax guangxiensis]